MNTRSSNHTILGRLRRAWHRLLHGKKGSVAAAVQTRSAEFNALLMERRLKQTAHTSDAAALNMPERWHEVPFGKALTYLEHSRNPEEALHLSDRAWGVIGEMVQFFAADRKQLSDDDVQAMHALLIDGEDPDSVMLATLFTRKYSQDEVAEHIRVSQMKLTGKQ